MVDPKNIEIPVQRVDLAEIDAYVANLRSLLMPMILVALASIYLARFAASQATFIIWGVLYVALAIWRGVIFALYSQEDDYTRGNNLPVWRRRMQRLSVCHAGLWGVFVLDTLPHLPLFHQFMVTWIIVVYGAVASVALPAGAISLRWYLGITLGSTAGAWLMSESRDGWMVSFSLLLIGLMYIYIGRRHFRDVRKRLHNASKLESANQFLEASNISKTRLIVEASHDLRQPVHALGMMLDRIDVDASRKTLVRRLHEVQTCVDTVSDMLIDLLDLSRLESGEFVVDLQPVNIGKLLRDLDLAYGPVAKRKNLIWIVSRSSAWVLTDPTMLKRVLNNLISNAIKYTPEGSVGVSCRYDQGKVQIRVTDTGTGIPPDQLDSIFGEYVRLDDARREPGYGIGLAVVKRMLDLLGHQLSVTSTLGKGSRFALELPRVEGVEIPEAEEPPIWTNPVPWSGRLIVFIENDAQLRASTAEALVAYGAYVIAASSVQEAMADPALVHKRPDLIISDMHLGIEQDGLASIEEMRREYPAFPLPAILLTGDLNPELQAQARFAEVRIVYKPVRPSRLREIVANALMDASITEPMPLQADLQIFGNSSIH